MTTKVVKTIKKITLFTILFFGILSCEKDIENVGVNLVENGVFNVETYNSDVKTYNQNILKRRAKALGQYLLGVYHTNDFGKLEASIATQLVPAGTIDFGTNPVIDTVILSIPYQATKKGTQEVTVGGQTIKVPEFKLDSVFGDQNVGFNLNVYELTSYLNTLDPLNPSEALKYYTDQTYNYNPTPLYTGLFKPSPNDTVFYVKRPEVILDYTTMAYDIDTIKKTNSDPVIRLPLNETFFTNNFLNNTTIFASTATFINFFRGLYIQATENTNPKASIMSLNLIGESNITIYYTNTVVKDETINNVDLNGDGNIDAAANVRTKQTAVFNIGGITTNTYTRNYTTSTAISVINTPNTINGDQKLYLQGAAGSFALIDLFTNDDINVLRSNNWLINEANLTFYIDQSAENLNVPEKLLVYNYDENAQMTDIFTEGPDGYDAKLQRDTNGDPEKYTINITNYISNVLKNIDPTNPSKLAVKVFNTSDFPKDANDTEIKDYSWTPKGVVLHGNQSTNISKRIKLEITYTKIN